jgi:sec-independent protein translocase protein TatC
MLAAILTPPDVVTQVMMAGPLLLLYEMSIWIAKIFGRKPLEVEEEEEVSA